MPRVGSAREGSERWTFWWRVDGWVEGLCARTFGRDFGDEEEMYSPALYLPPLKYSLTIIYEEDVRRGMSRLAYPS